MKQSEIRKEIAELVENHLRWGDPKSSVCMDRVENPFNKGKEGFTIQSAEEVLEDIIVDLQQLQGRLPLRKTFINQPTKVRI